MKDATPSQRRFEKTRQGILDAAIAILRESGIQGISIRALAERVDYSPSAIYKYFDSKEEILAALREEGWRLNQAMGVEMDFTGMTPVEMILAGGMNYMRFARTYPEYFKLMLSSEYAEPQTLNEIFNNPDFAGLTPLIEAAIQSGQLELPEGVSILHVRLMMWFLVHGASMIEISMIGEQREEFERAANEVFHAMTKFMAPRA